MSSHTSWACVYTHNHSSFSYSHSHIHTQARLFWRLSDDDKNIFVLVLSISPVRIMFLDLVFYKVIVLADVNIMSLLCTIYIAPKADSHSLV